MDQEIMQKGLRNMFNDPTLLDYFSRLKDTDKEEGDELREKMYNHILRYHHYVSHTMYEIDERIGHLETKVYGNKKNKVTYRSQQMLILLYLGIFENSNLKKITSNKKRAKLLATLLNSSSDNIEDDLSIINVKKSVLKSVNNLEFIQKVFEEAGLKEIVKKIELDINSLNSSVNSK